jgi:hypothetical protein
MEVHAAVAFDHNNAVARRVQAGINTEDSHWDNVRARARNT